MADEDKGGKPAFTPPATQEELDRIIGERVKREAAKYADYEDLKARAKAAEDLEQASKSQEQKFQERLAALEQSLNESKLEASKARLQAKYGIADEDAELFLTAADAEGLERQAKAFADRVAKTKAKAPTVPTQRGNGGDAPAADPLRELASSLFGDDTD